MVLVKLTFPLAPRMESGLTNQKEPIRKNLKTFAGNAEIQTLVLLDMTKNHVALRTIASHLDVLREKLLKNGANIKENRLI